MFGGLICYLCVGGVKINQIELIHEFLAGASDGISNGGKNLKICGNLLIHFNTAIAERFGEYTILNVTRYSLVTGRLQKIIRESLIKEQLITVKKVPRDYVGSLLNFVDKIGDKPL